MKITLSNISKRFKRIWIFKGVTHTFDLGKSYAFVGSNGSGKSTLLKTIAGFEHANKGTLTFTFENKKIHSSDTPFYFTYCAPYQELILEMTLTEFLTFHQEMAQETIDTKEMLQTVGLENNEDKNLDNFSSGMLQRLKLGISFYTSRPIILLDEPTSNLDKQGKQVFRDLFLKHQKSKLIIVASNEPNEFELCDEVINIEKYKI